MPTDGVIQGALVIKRKRGRPFGSKSREFTEQGFRKSPNRQCTNRRQAKIGENALIFMHNLALSGHNITEIAALMGRTKHTILRWFKDHPEMQLAFANGEKVGVKIVLASAFKIALGYEWEECKRILRTENGKPVLDENGNEIFDIRQKTNRHVPPNSDMIKFLLCNRDPEHWKNISEIVYSKRQSFDNDPAKAESDKITGLSRAILALNPAGTDSEHTVSPEVARDISEERVDEEYVCGDVQGEATDNLQDDVLDLCSKEGTE